jgi:hypothetical protein
MAFYLPVFVTFNINAFRIFKKQSLAVRPWGPGSEQEIALVPDLVPYGDIFETPCIIGVRALHLKLSAGQ